MRRSLSLLLIPLAAAAVLAAGCAQSDADVSITTKIRAKFDADRIITNPSQIQVTTSKKIVTLSGTVQTGEAKAQAVKLARSTDGVKDVIDQLTVTPGAAPQSASEPSSTGGTAGQPGGSTAEPAGAAPSTSAPANTGAPTAPSPAR